MHLLKAEAKKLQIYSPDCLVYPCSVHSSYGSFRNLIRPKLLLPYWPYLYIYLTILRLPSSPFVKCTTTNRDSSTPLLSSSHSFFLSSSLARSCLNKDYGDISQKDSSDFYLFTLVLTFIVHGSLDDAKFQFLKCKVQGVREGTGTHSFPSFPQSSTPRHASQFKEGPVSRSIWERLGTGYP